MANRPVPPRLASVGRANAFRAPKRTRARASNGERAVRPEEERGLSHIEQKIDWIVKLIIFAVAVVVVYLLFPIDKGMWIHEYFQWIAFPLFLAVFAVLHYGYDRIETLQRKAEERREAVELERQRAREKRAEEKRKDLRRRWLEFRGPGLVALKEYREWAASAISPDDAFNQDPPPFVRPDQIGAWKSLWLEKMIDCQERRTSEPNHYSANTRKGTGET